MSGRRGSEKDQTLQISVLPNLGFPSPRGKHSLNQVKARGTKGFNVLVSI